MAAIYIVALLSLATAASADTFFGGATSITAFANDVVTGYNAKYNPNIPSYDAVGSGAGINGFISGTYKVGASDEPMNNIQNGQADSAKGGKYTVPLILSSYNFMTKKASGLKLTSAKVGSIYKAGGITAWASIRSGLSGTIVPVARADSSGTTKVVSTWIATGVSDWPSPGTSSWSSNNYFKSSIVYRTGTSGVGGYLVGDVNAIGYIQTGSGLFRNLYETFIRNKANQYIKASAADPAQSIPRDLPKSDANWSGVTLINKAGKKTYPIVSFVYSFVGKKAGKTARQFMVYTQTSAAQNLVNTRYENALYRLPAAITRKNLIAVKKIKN